MTALDGIPKIDLYSDGGAEPNPGKGGYGLILSWNGYRKEFCEGFKLTTNNRMELMGVIKGLEKLKTKSEVQVYTDSKYVIDGIEKGWAEKWKANNWYRNKKDKAVSSDLWERLLELIGQHDVKFNWVKGHDGHQENERCDELAGLALNGENLLEDNGYLPIEGPTKAVEVTNFQRPIGTIKIENEGDLCRKCGDKVVKKQSKKRKIKPNQSYYFDYYLFCPGCKTMYMVENAKRNIDVKPSLFD